MRAVVFDQFGAAPIVRHVPEPTCPSDGVIVDVRATGLCRSDWHGWQGHDPDIRLPHVAGHEFAGVVSETGADVSRVQVGQRITVPFVCGCGRCAPCRDGDEQVCLDQYQPGFSGWGSFAERVVVPRADHNAVELPDTLPFVDAAALGCRFATAHRAVVTHGRVRSGDSVAVLGCGGVGLAAVMIAVARGARVVAVDVEAAALDRARELGCDEVVLDDGTVDVVAAIQTATGGGAAVTLDALGSAALCRTGIESLRPRGRHVQVGLLAGADATPLVPLSLVIARELEIYGSHGMSVRDYPALLADIASGSLRPGELVARTITLDDLAGPTGAIAAMNTGSPIGTEVVVLPG